MAKVALQTGYAPVNGLNLYYEIHGEGAPLVLLHGGFGATGMFGELLPTLTAHRQVIAVDLQGHGRTADIARPLRADYMADDIAALIAHFGLTTASVMGYSLGGGVALQTAIRHSALVDRLIVVSAAHKRAAWYPGVLAGMDQVGAAAAEQMKQTPMYQQYASIAPRPEDWANLWAKVGDSLRVDYDWSAAWPRSPCPRCSCSGTPTASAPRPPAEFFGLLGGGHADGSWDRSGVTPHRLAILPGTTHYEIFASPLLAAVVAPFLDAPSSATA